MTIYIRQTVEGLYGTKQALIEHRRSSERTLSFDELDAEFALEN